MAVCEQEAAGGPVSSVWRSGPDLQRWTSCLHLWDGGNFLWPHSRAELPNLVSTRGHHVLAQLLPTPRAETRGTQTPPWGLQEPCPKKEGELGLQSECSRRPRQR